MIINYIEKIIKIIFLRTKVIKLKLKYRDSLCCGRISPEIDTKIYIENGFMNIGQNTSFQMGVHLTAVSGGVLTIGTNCAINRYCIFIARKNIQIGNNVIFGPNVLIFDHDHKFSFNSVERDEFSLGDIVIDDGCWIGGNVTILRNTHIGKNSVIGAGCTIKGNIPPHSLVTNNRVNTIVTIGQKKV